MRVGSFKSCRYKCPATSQHSVYVYIVFRYSCLVFGCWDANATAGCGEEVRNKEMNEKGSGMVNERNKSASVMAGSTS